MIDPNADGQVVSLDAFRLRLRPAPRTAGATTAARAAMNLSQIAALLGVPLETFFQDRPAGCLTPPGAAEVMELVQAFCAIGCVRERRRALDVVRGASVAAQEE